MMEALLGLVVAIALGVYLVVTLLRPKNSKNQSLRVPPCL